MIDPNESVITRVSEILADGYMDLISAQMNIVRDFFHCITTTFEHPTENVEPPFTPLVALVLGVALMIIFFMGMIAADDETTGSRPNIDRDCGNDLMLWIENSERRKKKRNRRKKKKKKKRIDEKSAPEDTPSHKLCAICMDRFKCVANKSCGHILYCETCTELDRVLKAPCPVCREPTTEGGLLRVYE